MSSVGDLGAEMRRVLVLVDGARVHAVYAADALQDAWELLAACTDGTSDYEAQEALARYQAAVEDVRQVLRCLVVIDQRASAYVEQVGLSGSPQAEAAPPIAPVSRPQPSASGTWRGQTATGHARDHGRAIGRAPARPKQQPIREVRSVAELDELFAALSRGGQVVHKPSYDGKLVVLPDGTTIGYRVKSKTTVEPTIDIRLPDRSLLKIHVNTWGWD